MTPCDQSDPLKLSGLGHKVCAWPQHAGGSIETDRIKKLSMLCKTVMMYDVGPAGSESKGI